MASDLHHLLLLLLFLIPTAFAARGLAGSDDGKVNLLTPKAATLRYWSQKVPDGRPRPEFLVSKLSPLTVQKMAELQLLANKNALSTKLSEFCSWAHLFCFTDVTARQEKHVVPLLIHQVTDPIKNYSDGKNLNVNSIVRDAGADAGGSFNAGGPIFPPWAVTPPGLPSSNAGAAQFARNNHADAHSRILLSKYAAMEGIFFRESQLKEGNLVKLPDIKDKKPARSFLPRSISAKLPSTTAGLPDLLRVFKSGENSTFAYVARSTLRICGEAPAKGETKRCVASAEDMIDFAVDILGHSATAKATAVLGVSKGMVQIGRVEKINGGRITESVSCHQRPFPYMVYLCHSVPKVRVYEAEMLDPATKAIVNRGLAICHIDTSEWSPTHDSFILLGGGGPGKMEVCHWFPENDMAWVRAD